MKKFFSVDFKKIIDYTDDLFKEYYNEENISKNLKNTLRLLASLRNNEMHFFIDKKNYLCDNEFEKLHNFMIVFYDIIRFYGMIPYWGEIPYFSEYGRLIFDKDKIFNFRYKEVVLNSNFIKDIKNLISNNLYKSYDYSYISIVKSIYYEEIFGDKFDDLCTYIEMALEYDIIGFDTIEIDDYDINGEKIISEIIVVVWKSD